MTSDADKANDLDVGQLLTVWTQTQGIVEFGDSKSGQLLTVEVIALTALTWGLEHLPLHSPTKGSVVGAMLLVAAAILVVLFTIRPNRTNILYGVAGKPNVFNSNSIGRDFTASTYCDAIRYTPQQVLIEQLCEDIQGKADFSRRKFQRLYIAVTLTLAALGLTVISGIIEFVARL